MSSFSDVISIYISLKLDHQAGKAYVTLQLDLGQLVPHQQHVHRNARDRCCQRRADARKVNPSETEEATKTNGTDKDIKEQHADAEKVEADTESAATEKEAGRVAENPAEETVVRLPN